MLDSDPTAAAPADRSPRHSGVGGFGLIVDHAALLALRSALASHHATNAIARSSSACLSARISATRRRSIFGALTSLAMRRAGEPATGCPFLRASSAETSSSRTPAPVRWYSDPMRPGLGVRAQSAP